MSLIDGSNKTIAGSNLTLVSQVPWEGTEQNNANVGLCIGFLFLVLFS